MFIEYILSSFENSGPSEKKHQGLFWYITQKVYTSFAG